MAASDVRKVLRVPGTIVKDPTSLTAASPYGGTVLGTTKGLFLEFRGEGFNVTAEEFGFEVVERFEAGEVWAFGCFLRGYDNDAISHLFPNTAAGTVSQHRIVTSPGSVRAGHAVSGRSAKIAFVPDNADLAPSVVLYRALPLVEASARILFERGDEFGFPALWLGIRNTSGNALAMARRRDITL